ncbi:MAG: hypothetical protein IPJ11_09840 [Gemmatimonadetes bacterium]|nr:hypothetical protein [Gemmatimonadota bacterium]
MTAWAPPAIGAQGIRKLGDVVVALKSARWVVEDSLGQDLVNPNLLSIVRNVVIVTDPSGPAVVAYDLASGKRLWRYSKKGRGPGEMWEPGMAAWHPKGIVIVDNGARRLTVLDMKGRFVSAQPVPMGQFVTAVCVRPNGDALLNVPGREEDAMVLLPANGSRERRYGVLFPPGSQNPLGTGGAVDLVQTGGKSSKCIAARKMDEGLAALDVDSVVRRGRFIESVRQRPFKSYAEVKDTSELPIPFSLHAGYDGREVYVWFGGKSCARRCIDFYDPATLAYRRSYRLIGRTGISLLDLAIVGQTIVALGTRDGTPIVVAFPITSGTPR